MAHITEARARPHRRKSGHNPLFAPSLVFIGFIGLAAAYVAYVLWPRWPGAPVPLEAPALPIVVAGEMFNIEPAAIRQAVQRRPGTQQRVDLAYLWPSLTPPDPAATPDVATPVDPNERLFISITDAGEALPPPERVNTIYPRYFAGDATTRPDGLALRAFRDGTAYAGEDLVYDSSLPDDFVARCSRTGIGNSGMCLYERRIGRADIVVRFPRDWLNDWQKVAAGFDRLIARLHPG